MMKRRAMKPSIVFAARALAVIAVYSFIYLLASSVLAFNIPQWGAEQAAEVLPPLALVMAVQAGAIVMLVATSAWRDARLAGAVAFSMFGVVTVMSVSEAWYFGPALGITTAMVPGLVLPSLATLALTSPVAVLVFGRWRATDGELAPTAGMAPSEWTLRVASLAIAYVLLYFVFGSFVAWRNPALVAMYDPQAHPQVFALARLVPLQFLRGLLWVAFALPVLRMTRGALPAKALVVGLFLALPMNIVHVLPNPFMPDATVRLSHFVETASSNFIFGALIAWVLHRSKRRSAAAKAAEAKSAT